nr:hypothetical protein [Tanacetum cinerariifolium]
MLHGILRFDGNPFVMMGFLRNIEGIGPHISSVLEDWGTNPSDLKNELSLRTFSLMDRVDSPCCVGWIVMALIDPRIWVEHYGSVVGITTPCEIYSGPHDTQYYIEDPEQAFVEYASSCINEAGGRGFFATVNAVKDCRMGKIAVGEGITREWEIDRDVEINPFKDVLVFRRMVEFLGAIPINLIFSNMWESNNLIKNPINWDKPSKNRDGAWHAKIRLIDPNEEEFTKTLQSIPTTRKLFERESPREVIDVEHFYDT